MSAYTIESTESSRQTNGNVNSNVEGPGMELLKQRCRRPEMMDEPDLAPQRHITALHGLARLNLFSGSASVLWPSLAALAHRITGRPLRVLDFATGGGDVPLRLWRRARQSGLSIQIEGCDISPVAIEYASDAAAKAGADIRFFVHDALRSDPLPGYDAAISSLFMHHLEEDEVVIFLRHMAASGRLVLVNDLERSISNYVIVYVASRLLSASPLVHTDGPRSVAAAFIPEEARELAKRAGLCGVTVTRHWPCRFLLSAEQP